MEINNINNDLGLINTDKGIVVSSRIVAEKFDKQHKNILSKIDKTIEKWSLDNELKNKLVKYFIKSTYMDNKNENRKEYLLTRDGFSFIVMGFTGEKADKWKVNFIEAFNKMEEVIKQNNLLTQGNQTMFLAQQMQSMANTMAQFMTTSALQMQQMKEETKSEVKEIVRDSIIIKDEQIEKTADMIGLRDKNVKVLTSFLKDKLTEITNRKISAKDNTYIKIKNKIFKEFKVCRWEDIAIKSFNEVYAYIDTLEKDDIN